MPMISLSTGISLMAKVTIPCTRAGSDGRACWCSSAGHRPDKNFINDFRYGPVVIGVSDPADPGDRYTEGLSLGSPAFIILRNSRKCRVIFRLQLKVS
jgi:hypothetical protein